ncbi:gliding motility-associated C-terminal domain-containing protein [Flavobacterium sp. KBS0721]|uniref:HYR-like domain-containing protein n=1 Tax=Flavobacterium sp. KBS0721 TaxID=1179672 RepID=UPI00143D1319|nr:gliding motility-associated C-terminal domain-containing protein [Flavobacterium sp. KBS0721]
MKKFYYQYLALCYLFLMLLGSAFTGNAQVIVPFKERTSSFTPTTKTYHVKGNFTMMGNTNLTLQNYGDNTTNGGNSMKYVDIDGDNTTLNSSSSTLVLPTDSGTNLDCSKIVYAGLYWTGRVSNATNSPNTFTATNGTLTKTLDKRKILFKGPSASGYDTFAATDIYFPTNANGNMFTAYAEVTTYVKDHGVGAYFAADIAATQGNDGGDIGKYAGWALIVVYENSSMKNRDITIFDGHAYVRESQTLSYNIPVSGFNSVASGPVGIKLGIMAGEGDVNYSGDYFKVKKRTAVTDLDSDYITLSRTGNSTTNFFNSSIFTGGNTRNPSLTNNSGIDISMFDLPNTAKDIIGNNQTSTTFRYGSTVDTYTIFAIAMAVDAYVPEIEGTLTATTINGTSAGAGPYTVLPGQEMGYKLQIKNKGSEPTKNSKIIIPIPYNATFVPGSLGKVVNFTPLPTPNSLTYEPTIGANGSIVWDLGTLPLLANTDTVLAELTFKLKSTENCALLKNSNCSNAISVNGTLNGTGINSGVAVTNKPFILGYTTSGTCSGVAISAPLQTTINTSSFINANCQATPPTIAFTFCNGSTTIPITDVTGSFPPGSTFYNAYPIIAGTTTQYTINNPFPATFGTNTYYAIPPGATGGCYFQFTITVQSIATMPTVSGPVNYCIGDVSQPLTATPTNPSYTLYYYLTTTSTAQQSITPPTDTAGQFTYYVAEGISNACIGPKKPITVNIYAKPTLVITAPAPICSPAATLNIAASAIVAGSTAGLVYTFWKDLAATIPYPDYASAIPGTYYIKGTNPTTNCYDIKPVVVTKSTVLVTELTASHTNVNCYGQSTGSITVNNATGGVAPYTYSWKKDGNAYAGTTQILTNLGVGSYEVTATDANGCKGTLTIIITQPTAALALAASSKTDVTCFGKSTGSVTAGAVTNAVGTISYVWKNAINVSVGTTASVSNLPAGTYTLTVTDNCSTQTNSVTILQPGAALALAASSKTDITCFGFSTGTITAGAVTNSVGTVNYVWKNALNVSVGTTASVSNLPAGTYTLTVTDNCSTQTNSVTILQPTAALALAASSKTDVTCFGKSTGSVTAGAVTNAVGTVSYSWKNALNVSVETSASVSNLPAGTYTLTVTDNCSTQSNLVTILQPGTALSATTSQVNVGCGGGNNGSATVNVSGGTSGYTYSWDTTPVQTSATASGLIAGTYTVVIKDANLCTISKSVTITDGDAIKPIIDPLPLASTINCPALPVFATATATDNNGTISSLTYDDVVTQGTCVGSYTTTRTWTAVDACGNISLPVSQVINVQDITAPTWSTAVASLNKTIECSNAVALTSAQTLFPIASDLCDSDVSDIVKVSGAFVASAACSNAGTYTNTWTVKDDCGNTSDTFTQVITIQDTSAPTWSTAVASLNKTIECSDAVALTSAQALFPIASDLCDSDVSDIVKVSGAFVASAACSNAGTYTNTWTVKDDCGNTSDTFTQVITIQDTSAPTWSTAVASLNKTIECSDAVALTSAQALFPIALDSCDSDVSDIVKVSGAFVASADCSNAGTYTNTWTVKDDCGNTSDTFTQVITIQDTSAPTWSTTVASLNKTIECSDPAALTSAQALFPIASDLCDSDVSDIVKVSGAFVVSADCSNAGTYTNTWTVKDDCGNTSDTFTQVITIEDTSAPTWSTVVSSLNKTIECSNAAALTSAQALFPIASDLCDSDVLDIVKVSGAFVASAACSNAGTYTNTWTVKDDCGNTSDTFTQVITIEDTSAPTWSTAVASLNKTIECSDAVALTSAQALFPIASDLCDSDVLDIVKVSGAFAASADCSNAGTYTNTWTVKDDCGNTSDTFTQVITIQDTTKPTFIGELPKDITVSCDAVPEPANIEASDNCNGNLPIVFSEIKSDIINGCSTNYTLTRTWTTSDCGKNTATYTQIITVRDTTAPTGTSPADVSNLQTIADIPVGNSGDIKDAADNCSSTVDIIVSDSNNGGSGCDGNAFILTRTYTLTDCAGNKTELKQTFTVENKVSVSGVASHVTCLGGKDGLILVTNSPGSTVVIRNENNEVVGNTNLPAGTYTLTATSSVNSSNETCSATATVVISQPTYTVKISGQIINKDTNTPIANVPVTLVPQGTTAGPILLRITGADGLYNFSGMVAGSYLVQVQDANLNSAHQLYPVDSSLFFTTLEDCKIQEHNFEYGKSTLPVLGDYVWYDTNGNGIQDEWYDANNDGIVTKNIPDGNGAIDYSQWEWIDLNGDGSYSGPMNVGELNAGGFGNALSANVIIDGPNGYHQEVIVGIEGFWRDRPDSANPYGDYTIKLVKDANLDAVAATLGASGLVKVLPSITNKKVTNKNGKSQLHTVCSTTGGATGYIVTITPEDLVHLDADFGVNCKVFSDIVANDDTAGPIAGVNNITKNVVNVLPNDTLEGVVVTAADVIITTVTPNEFLQLNTDGSVDVLANAPVGTLTLVYQICEADQTTNCDTATVTVTIEAPVMTVTATPICVNDVPYIDYVVTTLNFTPVNGVTIAWANSNNNVISTMNDLPLKGRLLWPGAVVDQTGKGIDWPGWVFQDNKWIEAPDGFETLRPLAKLIISTNPTETITIEYPKAEPYCTARPTFAIVANDDNAGPINGTTGATNVINVYNNDSLNASAIIPTDVTLTIVTPDPKGALTLNPNGSVDVAAGTPGGTYTMTYQICENADAGNCDTAIVTVIVSEPAAPPTPVIANDDVYANIGCNTFGLVGNVLINDFKGITRATLELVNFTLLNSNNNAKTDPNITFDTLGNVTVSGLTPAGTYTYSYQICDKLSADNCDTATVTITVVPNGIVNISSQACNDDSTLIDLLSLLPENTPSTGVWIDSNNSNAIQGNTFNALGLALGNYTFEYKITDQNCPRSILLNMEINDDCKVLACGNVVVHNAFSPNGDGMNDVFKIDSIDDITCYPENNVEIYNRWGILVFETDNYNNTTNAFDGISRGRTTVKQSDGLPTGTYFYIINYKSLDGNNVLQNNKKDGYLYLSK